MTEELDVWEQNGFVNAKKNPLKQQTIWKQINKLREEININSFHEVSHTKQSKEAVTGNHE